MEAFNIKRVYANGNSEVIRTGVTREEAEVHCGDSETSSSTCHEPENVARTEKHGAWFDTFDTE